MAFRIEAVNIHGKGLVVTISQVPERSGWAVGLQYPRLASYLSFSSLQVQLYLDICNISLGLGNITDINYDLLVNFCDGHLHPGSTPQVRFYQ